eukprot:g2954.t1
METDSVPLSVMPSVCKVVSGATIGDGSIAELQNVELASACCDACNADANCLAWTHHKPPTSLCFLKDNTRDSGRPIDKHNVTCSGLRGVPLPTQFACRPPHDGYPFCNASLPVDERVRDLIARIDDKDKPNLLTARGLGGHGDHMQALPELGVPAYYWGTNCLHSLNGGSCVVDSHNRTRCPTNFPSGPAFGAMFDRNAVRDMARAIGVELRAMFILRKNQGSLDCWGPVVNLNRDPRWGRNGEGGTEDAFAMGQLAQAWTEGFQAPRPSKLDASRSLLQGVITLKHMAVNSLENTVPYTRHTFPGNSSTGVDPFVLADYYLRPFKYAIRDGGARGIMCSYNAVLNVPTCLSPVIKAAREQWGFEGYVTSDSDSVHDAYAAHHYVDTAEEATALALTQGQTDIDSGDTYNSNLLSAVAAGVRGLAIADVDRALYNTLKQRFDLGLFDDPAAYDWPSADDVGTDASWALTLRASQQSLVLLRNDGGLLPLPRGGRVAVVGPHARAQKVLVQPYPFSPYCAGGGTDCLVTPADAIGAINNATAGGATAVAPGCDLFFNSTAGFADALAKAGAADTVVLMLGIETCGMDPAHNVNPGASHPGGCYQEKMTSGYVFPDAYTELEAHDRTSIDLPPVQRQLARAVLALGKPTVLVLLNAGAVAVDGVLGAVRPGAQLAVVEAFYPGPRGGEALAQGLFGEHNRWGRLPYTIYPARFAEQADMAEHDLRVAPGRTYRYYRNATYDFGAGLSLTRWTLRGAAPACLDALRADGGGGACTVRLQLANAGARGGDAVTLAYFRAASWQQPRRVRPELLQPAKQLFDFQRAHDVGAGGSTTVAFNVTAASLALVDEQSGDVVSEPGAFTLLFDVGGGTTLEMQATVVGNRHVLEPFPADAPSKSTRLP